VAELEMGATVAKALGSTGRVAWEVIADDQYVMREFCDWADTIPLMAGAVFSEQSGTLARGDGRKNEWTQKEIDEKLAAELGDKKNDIVAEFKTAFPQEGAGRDLLRGGLPAGRQAAACAQARERQDARLQLPVRL
jgi:hypothetical protein